MDKSYMMGHSISKIGIYNHWSNIADYSSNERMKISDQLSIPNGYRIMFGESDEIGDKLVYIYNSPIDSTLISLVLKYVDNRGDEEFRALKDVINYFNKTKQFNLPTPLLENKKVRKLIRLINKHNATRLTEDVAKNIAVNSIIRTCEDVSNIQSAHSPIDNATKQIKKYLQDLDTAYVGDENDGISIFRLQEDNQTGKKVVGIMANALKAFLSTTQYMNRYYASHDVDILSMPFFMNSIVINGLKYAFSTVANTNLEEKLLKALSEILKEYAKPTAVLSGDDTSIILSAMVTLATD